MIAKTLFGKMNKLSNKGWSYHLRLVKMDQHSISYYRNVPKDFDGNHNINIKTNRELTRVSFSK